MRNVHSSLVRSGETTPTEIAMSCEAAWKTDHVHCTNGAFSAKPARATHESARKMPSSRSSAASRN